MTNRFMMSVAVVALIAGAGFANAQGTGNRELPSAGSSAQQSAPSSERGNSAAQSKPSSDMKASQSEDKSPGAAKNQRAEEKVQGQQGQSKSMSSESDTKSGKDMKAEGQAGKDMKAEGKGGKDKKAEQKGAADSKSQTTTQSQPGQAAPQSKTGQTTTQSQTGTSVQSQTTGQAGAAAKLSTEQRTRITTVIRDQHVQPLTSVNFSIAVGTRVPRDVRFYPLPREVVTIYPEWRGYEFILVNNQIIVIDPRTFEIVAILEA